MRALLVVLVLLLAPPLRAAPAPTLSDLDAALREAAALTIPGLAPGERQTKRREDEALMAQLKARNAAVERAEALGVTLLAGASVEQQMAVRVRLGWLHLDLAEALVNSGVPSYLTEERGEIYAVAMEDRAELQVREARAHAAAAVVLARGAPDVPGAAAVWSLWAVLAVQDRIPRAVRCEQPPKVDRQTRQHERMAMLKRDLAHLSADLDAYTACLPADLVEYGQLVIEQARFVVDNEEVDMAGDLLPFFDDLQPPIEAAIVARCGVAQHAPPGGSAPTPPPAAGRPVTPLDSAIPTLPALDVALQDAAVRPMKGLEPRCVIDRWTAGAEVRPAAFAYVELRAAPLLASRETHAGATLALASTYVSRAHADWLALPPTSGSWDDKVLGPSLAAVTWMAARADRLLLDVLGDPAATVPQRERAAALQADLQSWLPRVVAELIVAPRGR